MSDEAGYHVRTLTEAARSVLAASIFLGLSAAVADENAGTAVKPAGGQADSATTEKPTSPAAKSPATDSPSTEPAGIDLIGTDLSKTWDHFSVKDGVDLGDVWKIVKEGDERQLVCVGEPKGFLFTKKQYQNFVLTFEWRYKSDPNANSGVLVYTQKEMRLWPTSMQVQLHQPQAGCIFPSGDATSDSTTEPPSLAGAVGEWNRCRVVSQNGQLSVEINGKSAGKVSGCKPAKGFVALQSEGSETHFRRVRLLETADQATPEVAPTTPVASPGKPTATKPNGEAAG